MVEKLQKHIVLVVVLFLLGVIIVGILHSAFKETGGRLIYALDDPYIHMAIAKNLVRHGVWGVTPYEFSSSSSSLLYVLLLSLFYIFMGVNHVVPLILNILFAVAVLTVLYFILRNYHLPSFSILFILLTVLFSTPLPAMIFTGMEHVLHILLSLVFLYFSVRLLNREYPDSAKRDSYLLLALCPLLTMTRYESVFLIFVVATFFLFYKRWWFSGALGFWALLPLFIYGLISRLNGWYWLPNSVLLKGRTNEIGSLEGILHLLDPRYFWFCINISMDMLTIFISAFLLFVVQFNKKWAISSRSRLMIAIFLFTTILHVQFAALGWFYRYEAYLIALGVFVILTAAYEYVSPGKARDGQKKVRVNKVIATVMLIFFLLALSERGRTSLVNTPRAMTNIYEQHYLIASFLQQFYEGETVALNDIGAPNYYADIRCVDMWGLGTLEVARMKRSGTYTRDAIAELIREKGVKLAIFYESWFINGQITTEGIPEEWIKVAEWSNTLRIVSNAGMVAFYIFDPAEEDNFQRHMKKFIPHIPKTIIQSGDYSGRKYW